MKKHLLLLIAFGCCLTVAAGRPRIGLALGGGGAKGAAEVGVLKVIERAGIPIDYIAGTSMGSIVGGLYAAGYTANELDSMLCQQEWLSLLTDRRDELSSNPYEVKDGVTYIFGFPIMGELASTSIGGFGIMHGKRIEQVIDSMATARGCNTFESLKIPFCCVATEFLSATEVIIDKGSLSKGIRASVAIPGIFKPVRHDGMLLVDGGMMNNLPVDVVRKMGADIVIAVDLQQEVADVSDSPINLPMIDNGLLGGISELLGIGGLINWVQERPDQKKYADNVRQADIYINPLLPDMDASSFGNKNSARMIKAGEEEATQYWQQLMDLKQKLNQEPE
jgi:NTE family protein